MNAKTPTQTFLQELHESALASGLASWVDEGNVLIINPESVQSGQTIGVETVTIPEGERDEILNRLRKMVDQKQTFSVRIIG